MNRVLVDDIRLENQTREQLLETARLLLVEADALSSRIAAVNEIGLAINRNLDLESILKSVTKHLKWLMDFEYCGLCLKTETGWRIVDMFGKSEAAPNDILATENIGRALRLRQSQIIHEGSRSPLMGAYQSQVIVPLVTEEGALGTIHFGTTDAHCYTTDDLRIAYMLALQLASAIRNARHFAELMKTRDSLEQQTRTLQARNEELDAYSHTIAHDLKTPLSVITLNADLLLRSSSAPETPARAKGSLENIKSSASRMTTMIDQLLWLARLRDVNEAISQVLMTRIAKSALLRFTDQVSARNIEVEIEPLPDALGNSAWLEEVFANLISNAIKYMGAENTTPRIMLRGSRDGNEVRYEVSDSGIGIAPDDQKRLFQMFTRLHTVRVEGIGLGLSIVQRIVTKLGGRLGVESEPGKGSTFWFVLPAAP